MQIYQGKSVFSGIAIGKIRVYKKNERQVKRVKVENPDAEMARFEEAKSKGIAQLGVLYEKACKEVGEANAAIFEVHQMMMEDDGYNESVENIIKSQGVNAEYAVATTGDNFAQMFSAMDDDYMRERAADVKDISERLISILNGDDTDASLNDEPAIIVADDLAPSETVQMDKSKILAFVTVHGSTNSHTAILARMMNIPALIGVPLELEKIHNGTRAIVDGREAVFYLDPEEEQIRQAMENVDSADFTVLLTHRPELLAKYAQFPLDLVVSGHAHGGQVRIPGVLNGLYAPNQGWFPKLAGGAYTQDGTTLIVSRGLAVRTRLPRIFNRPEVVLVRCVPAE